MKKKEEKKKKEKVMFTSNKKCKAAFTLRFQKKKKGIYMMLHKFGFRIVPNFLGNKSIKDCHFSLQTLFSALDNPMYEKFSFWIVYVIS